MKISATYGNAIEDSNYHSYVCMTPAEFYDLHVKYLKEEVEKAASLNQSKPLVIGIGIGGILFSASTLARKASLKGEKFSLNKSARKLEEILRNYARRFSNVASVNVETSPTHITKRPVWVFGNYNISDNANKTR